MRHYCVDNHKKFLFVADFCKADAAGDVNYLQNKEVLFIKIELFLFGPVELFSLFKAGVLINLQDSFAL